MAQLTPIGLIRILGQVTLIMVVPMAGGAAAGILLDALLGTTPICVLSGFAAGNLVAILGIWLYIRRGLRQLRGDTTDSRRRQNG
jgi:hypothetical protein